jgi:hypothetical protein
MAPFRKGKPLTRYWLKSSGVLVCEIAHFDWPVEKVAEFIEAAARAVGGQCAIFLYPFEVSEPEEAWPVQWSRCASRRFYRKLRWPNHWLDWVGYVSPDANGLAHLLARAWKVSGNEEVLVLAAANDSLEDFEGAFVDDFPNGPNEIAATRFCRYVIARGHDGTSIRLLSSEPDHQQQTTELVGRILLGLGFSDATDVAIPEKRK